MEIGQYRNRIVSWRNASHYGDDKASGEEILILRLPAVSAAQSFIYTTERSEKHVFLRSLKKKG